MAIKGNLQKKVYQDQRTGVKRRWMQYSMAYRWLKIRDKTMDWGPPLVVFFSIISVITALDPAIDNASLLFVDETHKSSKTFINSVGPVTADNGKPFDIPLPKQVMSPFTLKNF